MTSQQPLMKDLYRFVNGEWLDTHVIPEDRGVDGTFHSLRDQAEVDVHELVKSSSSRAGKLYASFMDVPGIEAAGVAAIDEDLDRLKVETTNELATALGELDRLGVGGPVSFWVAKDSDGSDSVAYIVQSGLGLPDEAYYREHPDVLESYKAHVTTMLGFLDPQRLGGLSAEEASERIVALETDIARGHWDVVSTRDALKTFNPTEFSELPENVATLLRAARLPESRVIVMMPSYLDHINTLLSERIDDWKLLTTWHILHARAGVLTPEISRADFAFFGTTLSGATQQRDRWKRAVGLAESFVGEEIGEVFVKEHFPASSKKDMATLVDYLIAAYRERIEHLQWMTPVTRKRALEKLDKFNAKIGYPDTWRDYGDLEFSDAGQDLLRNVRTGSAYAHDYELSKLGKPADRSEWVTTPQTVNAFYNPVVNDITFPAAILRAPFYSPTADAAENFGAIGAVIGHEIGHGFDDQGSQYDGDGNLYSWWTEEDREAFTQLTSKLVEQFDGLVPSVLKESTGVNGKFTLGENIGDLGGLGIAVVAYQRYLVDHGEDTTGLQRLFLSWARIWRTAIRPELAEQYLAIDPHSPAEFRCNVIAGNIAEFYQTFNVPEDSPMWIAPEKRVTIW
ncbi:peptidase M13 [Corynebacterium pseudotuberculosis]|uniref:Peptidase M13 n=1 Tax=Corynebacterium pseudotuberculosis 258 TaxID=1168865 RepID=A0AAU8PI45_CORPS|nr:M13-type metalloendopeptidase [Corynebacterium pseudotuberculosis]AER68222.1 Metalloendopeptidase [Corynebacterium pseudotuberculosis 1/06-A]AEQ05673.2 peptidase M13 [Corynebacterium pseudotuberculosis CIP 52.97]AFB71443.2 peptidase M13 [Corynebacterium pseudotuberculosis 316]AFK15761.1 peptidase M13 [Corynebacterium pseudotuberculosis 258]AKS12454.1 Metalloendopeptidase [Corynebacterium pseudotuberculosis]